METDTAEVYWLLNPKTGHTHLVVHPETIKRCLGEGHIRVSDPRLPVPEESPSEPQPPMPDPDQQMAEVEARNDAARRAFGIPTPPKRVQASGRGSGANPSGGTVRRITKGA